MKTARYCNLPNLGYVLQKLDVTDVKYLQDMAADIEQNFDKQTPGNADLAGNLDYEFELYGDRFDYISKLVQPLAESYLHNTTGKHLYSRNDVAELTPELKTAWINFQQKHEFNPPHTHGGLLSFVIWLRIPYTNAVEIARSSHIPPARNYAGCFEFQYTDVLGAISNVVLPVDKNWEGTLCLFPAKMHHAVYPFFTSDDFRITISGNLVNVR